MKRLGIVISVIAIITLLIFGIYKIIENNKGETIISNNNIFTDELLKNTEKVELTNFVLESIVIEDKKDIKSLYNIIKPMKLNEFTKDKRDSKEDKLYIKFVVPFMIRITTKDKNLITADALSDEIQINEKWYHPDKDYCESLTQLFEKLSKKN